MKSYFFLFFVVIIPSCVSSKKYKHLEHSHNQVQKNLAETNQQLSEFSKSNQLLHQKITTADFEIQLKEQKIESLKKEHVLKDETIKNIENNLTFAKTNNESLTKRIDELSISNKVNIDIMKKLLEDAEAQHLKVLNLSLALQKQDSLNIHLVKRSKKKNISDEKIKKSLEKLGFVFY